MINKYKVIYLIILISYLCSMFSCNMKKEECNLQQFIGPKPGYKFLYKSDSGISLELIALSKGINEIEIEEVTDITALNLPTKLSKRLSQKYKLSINNDTLIKRFSDGEMEIVLKNPCISKKTKWEIIGKIGDSVAPSNDKISFDDMIMVCQVVNTGKESILGKERFVVATECRTKNLDLDTIRYEKYADDIGLIERSIKSMSNNNKEVEIIRFNISEIDTL